MLGRTMDLSVLEERFGEVYTDDPGRPPLRNEHWLFLYRPIPLKKGAQYFLVVAPSRGGRTALPIPTRASGWASGSARPSSEGSGRWLRG